MLKFELINLDDVYTSRFVWLHFCPPIGADIQADEYAFTVESVWINAHTANPDGRRNAVMEAEPLAGVLRCRTRK
jgi:hypothetical protein